MITRVEARNYRCLRSVKVPLRPFQILVGPNGSGKTALMDVLGFIRDCVLYSVDQAVRQRTDNYHDLVWGREESSFDLALEAEILEDHLIASESIRVTVTHVGSKDEMPKEHFIESESPSYTHVRYDLSVRLDPRSGVPIIAREKVALLDPAHGKTWALADRTDTEVVFAHEDSSEGEFRTRLPSVNSAVNLFPTGPNDFPTRRWFASLLTQGIRDVRLSAEALHAPSTLEAEKASKLTGANLARSVFELRESSRESFEAWMRHVRTALPDLASIRTEPLPQARARYLMLKYQNGIEVPSRVVSDGTLCLLALTILAYMPEPNQIYLIEEPENAVHPTAVETIFQSLSSLYDSQVLMASHSPILLSLAKPEELLCFTRTREGTGIVPGNEHPALKEWKGEVDLSDLFAAGVLG
ncbi:MAG TPA: AAA family ATPase [Terriglobia bacterium]|nr:AAA family ATPase [Terriglobia bacterium]